MSPHSALATFNAKGCTVSLRRFRGPLAHEIFLHCVPAASAEDIESQSEVIYLALLEVLEREGADYQSVVTETLFLSDIRSELAPARNARRSAIGSAGMDAHRPAVTEIEQPPLHDGVRVELFVQALLPVDMTTKLESAVIDLKSESSDAESMHALKVSVNGEMRLYAGNLCGVGGNADNQTRHMFERAEKLLHEAGMEFHDVMRTWIHLREMERDYPALNEARRTFFETRNINPVPASTGITGGPAKSEHDLNLGIYAVKASSPVQRTVMTSPTLNEAGEYGADFVRGMRVHESNRTVLLISGTASINETGQTAHVGDFEGQARRMLLNVEALLREQGAGFGDVVSAITYVKNPEDALRLQQIMDEAGYSGFPNALVEAPICRPDLLCETEALALLLP